MKLKKQRPSQSNTLSNNVLSITTPKCETKWDIEQIETIAYRTIHGNFIENKTTFHEIYNKFIITYRDIMITL